MVSRRWILPSNPQSQSFLGIVVAKEKGCTKASTESAKAVKKQKTACLKAFSKCKKAEDAAIALVHTCMAGEINTVAAKGEGRF